MGSKVVRASIAALSTAGSVVSFMLPWALYGDIDMALRRVPGWHGYLLGIVVLYACVAAGLLVGDAFRGASAAAAAAAVAAGVFTVAWATVLMCRYDDAAALFGGTVPMVMPRLGAGGPVAVLSVLLAVTGPLLGLMRPAYRRLPPATG